MTEYQKYIHENMWTKTIEGKWYSIKPDREDYEQFMAAINHFIQTWGCAEFNSDFTKFRRTEPINMLEKYMNENSKKQITQNKASREHEFSEAYQLSIKNRSSFYEAKKHLKSKIKNK